MTQSFSPLSWPTESDWTSQLGDHFDSDSFQQLCQFVEQERAEHTIFPPTNNVFQAFQLTPYTSTKVVILGQDPYHGPNQAHGLAFSVLPGIKLPPSLRNIFKEWSNDLEIDPNAIPVHGDLSSWAAQGVLLLNTVLTVRDGQANSHQKKGWEEFTDFVMTQLNAHPQRLVFILWGKPAAKKKSMIDSRHTILESPHPSPLSSYRGFFDSKPFSKTNRALESFGRDAIQWESILD